MAEATENSALNSSWISLLLEADISIPFPTNADDMMYAVKHA